VLSACQYIRRSEYPADYPAIQGDDPQAVLIRGGNVIVSPLGRVLTGPDREALLKRSFIRC
jgi:nitrilase